MRFAFVFLFLSTSLGCGGATNEPTDPSAGTPSETPAESRAPSAPGQNDSPTSDTTSECPSPAPVIARSGTTIRQPVGSVQRFQLVYQGSDVGVTALRGVDMIVGGSDGPFSAQQHAGYWAEVRDASGTTTFTRLLQDPTRQEVPAGNGGFANATIDKCIAKTILVDVPRSASGSVLVVFGMAYGAQATATELARFTLE
jgi:hypothetical protein